MSFINNTNLCSVNNQSILFTGTKNLEHEKCKIEEKQEEKIYKSPLLV